MYNYKFICIKNSYWRHNIEKVDFSPNNLHVLYISPCQRHILWPIMHFCHHVHDTMARHTTIMH
jgi:hypothetical protein